MGSPFIVKLPNLDYIKGKDPKLYETIVALARYVPPLKQPPPPAVSKINAVSLGNGSVDVTIEDNGEVTQAVNYFIEHADSATGFGPSSRVEHLGPSRNRVIAVGSGSRVFRAYSQYQFPPSDPNAPIVFGGSSPTPVVGGGTATPALMQSTGSGTAATDGQVGGHGFGKVRTRKP